MIEVNNTSTDAVNQQIEVLKSRGVNVNTVDRARVLISKEIARFVPSLLNEEDFDGAMLMIETIRKLSQD